MNEKLIWNKLKHWHGSVDASNGSNPYCSSEVCQPCLVSSFPLLGFWSMILTVALAHLLQAAFILTLTLSVLFTSLSWKLTTWALQVVHLSHYNTLGKLWMNLQFIELKEPYRSLIKHIMTWREPVVPLLSNFVWLSLVSLMKTAPDAFASY